MFFLPKKFKTLPPNEFIERILCTVPGMTSLSNIYLMDKAIALLPENCAVLEIGSFCGQSAVILSHLLRKHNKKATVVCVDPFIFEGWQDRFHNAGNRISEFVGDHPTISRKEYLKFVEDSFHTNVSFFCQEPKPVLYKMESDDFFYQWQKGNIPELKNMKLGFSYIDGNHSKVAAINDARNCLQQTVNGGWILMDDTNPKSKLGSADAGKEICQWKELELADQNPNLLFRKI